MGMCGDRKESTDYRSADRSTCISSPLGRQECSDHCEQYSPKSSQRDRFRPHWSQRLGSYYKALLIPSVFHVRTNERPSVCHQQAVVNTGDRPFLGRMGRPELRCVRQEPPRKTAAKSDCRKAATPSERDPYRFSKHRTYLRSMPFILSQLDGVSPAGFREGRASACKYGDVSERLGVTTAVRPHNSVRAKVAPTA